MQVNRNVSNAHFLEYGLTLSFMSSFNYRPNWSSIVSNDEQWVTYQWCHDKTACVKLKSWRHVWNFHYHGQNESVIDDIDIHYTVITDEYHFGSVDFKPT